MKQLSLLALLLSAAAGVHSQCALPCSDRQGWCGSYKTYCSFDANTQRNCELTCGICDASENTKKKPDPNNPKGCGAGSAQYPPSLRFSGDKITGLKQGISGGAEAAPNSYPFLVRFHSPVGMCTASIIGEEWVLTAAHCVADNNARLKAATDKYVVYTGAHSQNDGQCVGVKRIIVNSAYRGACRRQGTDIALVQLAEKLTFGPKVQPICLPAASDDYNAFGDKLVAAGWGWAHQSVKSTPLQHNVFTTDVRCGRHQTREVCAWGGQGAAACPGDSGGPLFFKQNGKWTQAGIAECGSHTQCGSVRWPSVYVHVPAHRDWIKQNTGL